ncbi:MAG: N-acetyl-gamma-glutamyl-phosphate reductase, partial [Candidatus Limnocylindria bacterium]
VAWATGDSQAGAPIAGLYPNLAAVVGAQVFERYAPSMADGLDAVFFALPHGASGAVVPEARTRAKAVFDLGADFRLKDAALYPTWYGDAHPAPDLLADFVYGLPELHRKAIAAASLVAAPGCYPAGAILAVAPLLRTGLARLEGIVIDGKSGVSGAGAQGRKIDPMYLYTEANENVQAYGVGTHRHTPEIEQELSALAGSPVCVTFTPHLLPLNRGLYTTAVVPLATAATTTELLAVYRDFYAGEPFVRVLDEGERPTTRAVLGSNFCDVTVVADPRTGRAVCLSALDNLGKGGAANGVQNLNLLAGWSERAGLEAPPVYP